MEENSGKKKSGRKECGGTCRLEKKGRNLGATNRKRKRVISL